MSTCLALSVEIELPDTASEKDQDVMVKDLCYEPHIQRLRNLIKQWVCLITGGICHVEITVD